MILFLELNNVKNDFSTFDVTSNSVKCQLMMKLCCNSREVCVRPMALKAGDFPFCVDGGTHKDEGFGGLLNCQQHHTVEGGIRKKVERSYVWGKKTLKCGKHRKKLQTQMSFLITLVYAAATAQQNSLLCLF